MRYQFRLSVPRHDQKFLDSSRALFEEVSVRVASPGSGAGRALGLAVTTTGAVPSGIPLDRAALTEWGFAGKAGEVLILPREGGAVVATGVGDDPSDASLRDAAAAFARGIRTVRFTCTLDCIWELRVAGATTGATRLKLVGYGRAMREIIVSLKGRKLGTGQVRFSITLTHPLNPGTPQTRESGALTGTKRMVTSFAPASRSVWSISGMC